MGRNFSALAGKTRRSRPLDAGRPSARAPPLKWPHSPGSGELADGFGLRSCMGFRDRMKSSLLTPALPLFLALFGAPVGAQAASDDKPIPVTPDNFVRAESDLYFSGVVKDGGFGKFMHRREPTPIAEQTIIRMNRDTLYSAAVFDLDAGPVTITLPDPGKRFLSMQMIDEDEYTPEVHLWRRRPHPDQGPDRHALRPCRRPHPGRSGRSQGRRGGPRAAGCDHGQPARRTRGLHDPQLGRIEPGQGARRPAQPRLDRP